MADLDPILISKLEKLGIVADANAAALGASTNSMRNQIQQRVNEKKAYDELIKNIKELSKVSDDEAKQIADKVAKEEAAYRKKEQQGKKEAEAIDKYAEQTNRMVGLLGDFASKSISASQSIYNSDKSFAAVVPTLELIGSTTTAVITALGKSLSGVSFLGVSWGKATEAISDMANVGIGLAVKTAQAQIENAQKFIDTYQSLSKTGVTFGASITALQNAAGEAGLSMTTYSKFILNSVESLSIMGGGLERAAAQAAKLSKTVGEGDHKLVAMYGSFDALNSATADFLATQARYGSDTTRTNRELTVGAREYLYNMKELSELTGKSADQLKKADEARSTSAAYQAAMAEKSLQDQENTKRAITVAQQMGGETAAKYAQEYVATGGRVTSEMALKFQAMYPVMSETVRKTLTTTDQATASYNLMSAQIIQDRRLAGKEELDQRRHLFRLQAGGVKDETLELVNAVGAAGYQSQAFQANVEENVLKAAKERQKAIDGNTKSMVNTMFRLEKYKKDMDESVVKAFGKTAEIVNMLYEIQIEIDKLFGPDKLLSKGVSYFLKGIKEAAKALEDLGMTLTEEEKQRRKFQEENPHDPEKVEKLMREWLKNRSTMGGNQTDTSQGGGAGNLQRPQLSGTSQKAVNEYMSGLLQEATDSAVRYGLGGGHRVDWKPKVGASIDCSGWVAHINREMMLALNKESMSTTGKAMFKKQALDIFNPESGVTGNVQTLIDAVYGVTKQKMSGSVNDVRGKLTAGMIVATGAKGQAAGHVGQIFEEGGKLYISVSEGKEGAAGSGPRRVELDTWLNYQSKKAESEHFQVVNPLQMADEPLKTSAVTGYNNLGEVFVAMVDGIDRLNSKTEETNSKLQRLVNIG